jgi:phosphatidylglycerol---prolipoprotein diacylglyceryl transferase
MYTDPFYGAVMSNLIAYLLWNPDRIAFTIPWIHWPVAWYGLLFVGGIFASYILMTVLFRKTLYEQHAVSTKAEASTLTSFLLDRLLWYIVISIMVGARLGHILFYDFDYYVAHPLDILKIWQGGLASHGAGIAIPLGLMLFYRNYKKMMAPVSFFTLFDLICLTVPLCGGFIRIGNFINQEITGRSTEMPWGVIFLSPLEGGEIVPRHPVQLYEAAAYFILFAGLVWLYTKKEVRLQKGLITGLVFTLLFTARFFLEFFKAPQSHYFHESTILLGQWLSLPFILVGLVIIYFSFKNKN